MYFFFFFFIIKNYFNPTKVNATDRSNAVVLCYSFFGWLCGFYYGAFHVESFLALCAHVFSSFDIVTTSPEEEGLVYVLLMHLFVYFTRVDFYSFACPLGVGGWLRLEFSINLFTIIKYMHISIGMYFLESKKFDRILISFNCFSEYIIIVYCIRYTELQK